MWAKCCMALCETTELVKPLWISIYNVVVLQSLYLGLDVFCAVVKLTGTVLWRSATL